MSASSEFEDEFDLVKGMFDGTVAVNSHTLRVELPFCYTIDVTVPQRGYPETSIPSFTISGGHNAFLISRLERSLSVKLPTIISPGMPSLIQLIQVAMEEASEIEVDVEQEQASTKLARECESEMLLQSEKLRLDCGIDILPGEPIVDRKSKFLAHVAKVSSLEDVHNIVDELRSNRSIAAACHPSIYAYRFRDAKGVLHQDSEDDGEAGASKKILFLMDSLGVLGYVVIVTRWFGGILLGPDRFKHIMNCSKQALVQHGIVKAN